MSGKFVVLFLFTLAVLAGALPSKKKDNGKSGNNKDVAKKEDKSESVKKEEKNSGSNEEGGEEDDDDDDVDVDDSDEDEDNKHMAFCLAQENVTEEEMKAFLITKTVKTAQEPLKKAILCFLKKIEFFDGKTWNVENIAESIGEATQMFKTIKTCLKKDDRKLQAHERTYRVQKCVLDANEPRRTN